MGSAVEELLRAGHEVQWLVAPIDAAHPEVGRLTKLGARVEKLPEPAPNYVRFKAARRKLRSLFSGNAFLGEKIGAFHPDHIFVNQGGTWCALQPELFELLQGRKGRYSLICHLGQPGGFPEGTPQAQGRELIRGARRVYFNSRWTQRMAEEQIGAGIENSRLFQYPVRFDFSQPLAWPAGEIPRIGMVNRIDIHHKGLDLAVEAVSLLKKEGVRLELTVVGRGGDEAKFKEMIQRHGVEKEVKMEPYTEDLQRFWAGHELLLLPSRFEGLAVSMVEAMGFGRPVIRTPYGGCEEWMEEGVNGWICPEAGVAALVDTLRKAVEARGRWREMGVAAHRKVKKDLELRPGRVFLESLA